MPPDTSAGHGSHALRLAVAIASAAAIGPLAGLASWQIGLSGHRGSMPTQAQLSRQWQGGSLASSLPASGASAAAQPWNASSGGGSSAPTVSRVPAAPSTPYLYLVGSAAQENEVQQRLDQVAIGWQPLDATVLVVAPATSPEEVTWLRDAVNQARWSRGLAPTTVEDLRIKPPQTGGGLAW